MEPTTLGCFRSTPDSSNDRRLHTDNVKVEWSGAERSGVECVESQRICTWWLQVLRKDSSGAALEEQFTFWRGQRGPLYNELVKRWWTVK